MILGLARLWRLLLWLPAFWLGLQGTAWAQTPPFALRSISFPLIGSNYLDDNAGWVPVATAIQQMKALGANDVKVTISAGAYDTPTANLPNPAVNYNPSDEKILEFLGQLRAAGLQVTLQPFVNINFDPNGNLLDTVHAQPTDFNAWMQAHAAAMVRYARLAQQAGVERYVVMGDEVQPLTYGSAHTAGWLDMIAQVRSVYPGQITSVLYTNGRYQFGGGASHIELTDRAVIDAMDILGIGWFPQPITNTASPGLARLVAGWRNTVNGVDTVAYLRDLNIRYAKPVWISDIAFHSFSGDNVRSNDIFNTAIALVADQQEQADEYESLLIVLSADTGSWFLGVSFDSWNRFPPGNCPGVARFLCSPYGENIQGKIAEGVLAQWYGVLSSGGAGSVAAILPSSRSVGVGATATVFATVINSRSTTVTQCAIAPTTGVPAAFTFQTADAANQLIGPANTAVDIPPGGAQSFVLSLTPTGPFSATDVTFAFWCANAVSPAPLLGVNTLLLSASATPVPDIVALAASGDPGIVDIPGAAGTGVFAVATVNVGAGASITASADTGSASLPVSIALCQTNPATGVCLGSPAGSVTTQINAGETPTFGIFVTGGGTVPFDPANNRVFVRFKDAGGITRGATSVAVRTQ
jgi:hypothetical protein